MAGRGVQVASWAAVVGIAAIGGVLLWNAAGRPGLPGAGAIGTGDGAAQGAADSRALEPDPWVTLTGDSADESPPAARPSSHRSAQGDDAREADAYAEREPSVVPEPDDDFRIDEIEDLDAAHAEIRSELARILLSDADPVFRAAAAQKLAESDSDDARATLILALEDPDPKVLIEVLHGLEDIHDSSALPYIAPLLRHPDPGVAEAAHLATELLE